MYFVDLYPLRSSRLCATGVCNCSSLALTNWEPRGRNLVRCGPGWWAGSDVLLAYVDARITVLHPHLTRGLFRFSMASSVSSEPLVEIHCSLQTQFGVGTWGEETPPPPPPSKAPTGPPTNLRCCKLSTRYPRSVLSLVCAVLCTTAYVVLYVVDSPPSKRVLRQAVGIYPPEALPAARITGGGRGQACGWMRHGAACWSPRLMI